MLKRRIVLTTLFELYILLIIFVEFNLHTQWCTQFINEMTFSINAIFFRTSTKNGSSFLDRRNHTFLLKNN